MSSYYILAKILQWFSLAPRIKFQTSWHRRDPSQEPVLVPSISSLFTRLQLYWTLLFFYSWSSLNSFTPGASAPAVPSGWNAPQADLWMTGSDFFSSQLEMPPLQRIFSRQHKLKRVAHVPSPSTVLPFYILFILKQSQRKGGCLIQRHFSLNHLRVRCWHHAPVTLYSFSGCFL